MIFDPFQPQPFNVNIGAEREAADEMPRHAFVPPPIPYDPPDAVLIERDADLYPPRRHGVLPNRVRE